MPEYGEVLKPAGGGGDTDWSLVRGRDVTLPSPIKIESFASYNGGADTIITTGTATTGEIHRFSEGDQVTIVSNLGDDEYNGTHTVLGAGLTVYAFVIDKAYVATDATNIRVYGPPASSISDSALFLTDTAGNGDQSSTKHVKASTIASYVQIGAPLARGSIIVGNASGVSSLLADGTAGQVLTVASNGQDLEWASGGGGGGASALNDLSDVTYSSNDLSISNLDTINFANGADSVLQVLATTGTTAGRDLTISAGSTATGSNNIDGGDLILKAGGGDGTGTSQMFFHTKMSGTDTAAERLRITSYGAVYAQALQVGRDGVNDNALLYVGGSYGGASANIALSTVYGYIRAGENVGNIADAAGVNHAHARWIFDGNIRFANSEDNNPTKDSAITLSRNNASSVGSKLSVNGSPQPGHAFTKQTVGTIQFSRDAEDLHTGARLRIKTDDIPNIELSNALHLNGSSDYVDLGDYNLGNKSFTELAIHARIYVDALPGAGNINTIIGKYATGAREWQLYLDENGAVTFDVQHTVGDDTAAYKATTPNSVIATGKWYTILASFHRDRKTKVVVVYDDSGTTKYHVGLSSGNFGSSDAITNTAQNIFIGKGTTSNDFFDGKIMEVATWGLDLSGGDTDYAATSSGNPVTATSDLDLLEYAKTFYNAGARNNLLFLAEGYYSGGVQAPAQRYTHLTGYWDFNESSGSIVYDRSDVYYKVTSFDEHDLHHGIIYGGEWVASGLSLAGSRKYLNVANYPCSLSFQTTRENSIEPIERLRITSSGEAAFQNLNSSALLFSDNTKYLDAGYIDKLTNSTTFTINVWVNLNLSANRVIWKMEDDDVSEYIYLQVTTSGKLELYWVNTSDSAVGTAAGQAVDTYVKKDTGGNQLVSQDNWHQITVVYNGSLAATSQTELFRLKMYLDGQHVTDYAGETSGTGSAGTADTITWNDKGSATPAANESIPLKTPNFTGGKFFLGDDGTNSIVGTLGESSVWTVALTGAQVKTLYNEGSPYDVSTMEKDALIAYWKMEEITSANKVVNSIKSGTYDLTAVNSPIVSVLHQLPAKTLQVAADNVQTFRNPFYMQNNYISDNIGSSIVSSNADGNGGMYISPDGNVSLMDESTCIEVQDPIGTNDPDTYLTVSGVTQLNEADNWTVSIWVYPTALGFANALWRFQHGNPATNRYIALRSTPTVGFFVNFYDASGGSTVHQQLITPSGTLELNKWAHYVVTYDRSQFDNSAADNGTSNMCKVYKDGVQLTLTLGGTTTDSIVGSLLDDAYTLIDGSNPNPAFWIGNSGGGNFEGRIGETALWNRTLTATEITKLYDNGHPFPPNAILDDDTNLLGYWKMNPQQDTDKDGAWDDETTPAKDTWFTTPVTASGGFNHANGWGYGGNHHKVINEVSEGVLDAYIKHYNSSYYYKIVPGLPAANAQMTNDGFSVLRGGFKNYLLNQTSGFFVPPTGNTILGTFNATQKGVTPTGVTSNNTGISAVVDSSTPTIVGTVNNIGAEITVTGGTSGTQNNTALSLKATGADTNTHIKCLYDDTNYMTIATGANGATTLSTEDSDGTAANLVLDIDGDIDLDSATGEFKFKANGGDPMALITDDSTRTSLIMYENAGASTTDYFKIQTATHGSTVLSTIDDAASAANFTIDADGDISLKTKPGGSITLIENDGTAYTPTAASDAVPLSHMPYVLYSQFQDDMGTSKHYLPLRGYFEQSSVGGEPTGIVSPFNLKLQKAVMRCSQDISGGTWKLGMWAINSGTSHTHHHTTGMNWISATGGASDTNATFDFTGTVGLASSGSGGSNAVTAGQWIDFALQSDTDVTSSSAEFWITFFFIADLSNTI